MAVTVTLWATPATVGLGRPRQPDALADPGLTTMALWLPVIEAVTVSVAVTDRVPAVLRVTLKTWPRVGGREGVVRRQDGRGIGAGEVDGAGVAGGGVAVGVLGGDRDVVGDTRDGRARETGDGRDVCTAMKAFTPFGVPSPVGPS